MPRPPTSRPPSSAIARYLDGHAALRGMAQAPAPPEQRSVVPLAPSGTRLLVSPTGERANIKRELVLTRSADETLTALVTLFRHATGSKLTHSHVARALLRLLSQRMHSLQIHATTLPRLALPSNARGHEAQRDQFEQILTTALAAALANPPS